MLWPLPVPTWALGVCRQPRPKAAVGERMRMRMRMGMGTCLRARPC